MLHRCTVEFNSVSDAVIFTQICNKYNFDIDVYVGSILRDAKSLNSNLEFIGYGHINIDAHTNDPILIQQLKKDIRTWIVE